MREDLCLRMEWCDARRSIGVDDFEMETKNDLTFVAVLNEHVIGYIAIFEPDWFIHHLFVDPKAQGAGIGKALLTYVEKLAEPNPLSLKCQTDNARAIVFYKSLGFAEPAERGSNEYGDWIRLAQN